jgi:Leucine-rich repeat (LRR) protein
MRTNQFLLKVLLALQAIGLNFIECEESTCDSINGLNGGCQCKQTEKPNSLSIFCTGKEVTESNLDLFPFINDNFFALVIQNTSLKTISENTFNSSFERIFIENNSDLETIDSNSFKQSNAKYLVIRYNPKLEQNEILGLTKALSSVERIEFEGNNFHEIPKDAFSMNRNLKNIFLQGNKIESIRDTHTFGVLPNLSQIVLEHNELKEINGLQFMNTTKERKISVFLNNNKLTEVSFKGQEEDYQKQENVTVKLFLENNKFKSVPKILEAFLKGSKNELYFLNNEFDCQKEMKWLKQYEDQVFNVWCSNLDESFFRVDIQNL